MELIKQEPTGLNAEKIDLVYGNELSDIKLIPSLLNLINWLQMMTLKNQNEISFKKKQRSRGF